MEILLVTLGTVAFLVSLYLAFLAVLARPAPPPMLMPPRLRFDLIVPAHDEAAGITATVAVSRWIGV